MKRLFLLIATSFFILTLFANPLATFAQEVTPALTEDQQSSPSTVVKYDLAYPGILPDHPLYKLKVLRDKITAVIISDPRKKIDFYLLQTDKGLLASAILVDKGKIDLAVQTALKAEHNFTLLTQELYRLKQLPDDSFFKKLETASLKHQEVLHSLAARVPKDQQEKFLTVADFSKRNWESVEKYKKSVEEFEQEQEEERKAEEETEAAQ